MVRIVWSREAIDELEGIRRYIEQFNFRAARLVAQRLVAVGESLSQFPERGAPIGHGLRQMATVWPYLLRYRYEGNEVHILSIRHGARSDG